MRECSGINSRSVLEIAKYYNSIGQTFKALLESTGCPRNIEFQRLVIHTQIYKNTEKYV